MTFEGWEHLAIATGAGMVAAWIGKHYWDRRRRDDQAIAEPGALREWARQAFVARESCDQCKSHQAAEDGHVVRELREFKVEVLRRLGDIEHRLVKMNGSAPSPRSSDDPGFDPRPLRTGGGKRIG